MLDQDHESLSSLADASCEAVDDGISCEHAARYLLSVEEEGPEITGVIAARHVCAGHLASVADWAFTLPTPYADEAEDVYLTLYERRITLASLTSGGSPGSSVNVGPGGNQQGVFSIT